MSRLRYRIDTVFAQLTGRYSFKRVWAKDLWHLAGRLLQDKQLYEKLNKTVDEVGGLVAAIKADPRKYLNVRVSIF